MILNRLWSDQPLSYRSWAVQPRAQPLEREFWRRRDVDVHELPLERYVETLAAYARFRDGGGSGMSVLLQPALAVQGTCAVRGFGASTRCSSSAASARAR